MMHCCSNVATHLLDQSRLCVSLSNSLALSFCLKERVNADSATVCEQKITRTDADPKNKSESERERARERERERERENYEKDFHHSISDIHRGFCLLRMFSELGGNERNTHTHTHTHINARNTVFQVCK